MNVDAMQHGSRGYAADWRDFSKSDDCVTLCECIHGVLMNAVVTEGVVAIKTAIVRVVVAMTAEDALRRARRAVRVRRVAVGDVISKLLITAIVENINRIGCVKIEAAVGAQHIVGASAVVEWIENVGEQVIAVHVVVVSDGEK
jgi:hypothetical protein